MGLGIPPLKIKIMLQSNPVRSRILVRRLAEIGRTLGATAKETPHVPSEGGELQRLLEVPRLGAEDPVVLPRSS